MRQTSRLRQTIAATALKHPTARLVEIDPVPYRNVDRLNLPLGAQRRADHLIPINERSAIAGIIAKRPMLAA